MKHSDQGLDSVLVVDQNYYDAFEPKGMLSYLIKVWDLNMQNL